MIITIGTITAMYLKKKKRKKERLSPALRRSPLDFLDDFALGFHSLCCFTDESTRTHN